jgi:Methyltransferase domain
MYRVARCEASGIDSSSVDVVTVAQAIHWLDRDAFYREAKRVLVTRGVIAVWCYGLVEFDHSTDALVRRFYAQTVGQYWPPERRLVDEGYRTIEFPFTEFALPSFAIEQQMTLDQLGGYLRTWSATRRYAEEHGEDPVAPFLNDLRHAWGDPTQARHARWPLAIRAGRYDE